MKELRNSGPDKVEEKGAELTADSLLSFCEDLLATKVEPAVDRIDRLIFMVNSHYDTTAFALFCDRSEQIYTISCGCGWRFHFVILGNPDSNQAFSLIRECLVQMFSHYQTP